MDESDIEWASFDLLPGYAVNNMGDVFNTIRMKYLTPSLNDNGFVRVGLMVGNVQKFLYVHRLVAMAFLPDYEDGYEVLFRDGNKRNCQVKNLYMGSRRSRRANDGLF